MMEVYSFSPSVRTSFQHRVMAALDNWFFLGGRRLKVVSLDSCNSGQACEEYVPISTTEKVLKILSYLLIPIVIIALLIRYLLHSNFTAKVSQKPWLKTLQLGIDIKSFILPGSHVNTMDSATLFKAIRLEGKRVDVEYHRLHSSDKVVFYIPAQKLPDDLRLTHWLPEKETRKTEYVRHMLAHVMGYLTSQGKERLQQVVQDSRSSTSLGAEKVLQYRFIDHPQSQGEFQRLLNENITTKGSEDKEVVQSDLFDMAFQCWWPQFISVIQSPTFSEELVHEMSQKLDLDCIYPEDDEFEQKFLNTLLKAVLLHGFEGISVASMGVIFLICPDSLALQIPFLRNQK
ncbi:hypothetical protein [Chlamydia pneumoniae J138]|nr:hypothetical protein [Chlamydia pneumoniae J138]